MRELFIVTGPMRSGKTTFCKKLFALLEAGSIRPFAIVEENLRDPRGIPVSLTLHDLGADEERPLASRATSVPGLALDRVPGSGSEFPYPPFRFSEPAFSWARDRAKAAVEKGCGPVLVDEIGPLEADEGKGFFPTVAWLLDHGDCPLLVTMRPGLEKAFLDRLSGSGERSLGGAAIFHCEADREEPQTVAAEIFRHCQDRKGAVYYSHR